MKNDFDKLLKSRVKEDIEREGNAYEGLADVLKDKGRTVYRSSLRTEDRAYALKDICEYFGFALPEFNQERLDKDKYVEDVLRSHGVMSRKCTMKDGWYKDAFGVYMCVLDDDQLVAVLPRDNGRYYFNDRKCGQNIRVDKDTAKRMDSEAVLYYVPLPNKSLTPGDLFVFMKEHTGVREVWHIILVALTVTLLGMVFPAVSKWMFMLIIPSGMHDLVLSLFVFLLGCAVAKYLFSLIHMMLVSRLSQKLTVIVQSAMFSRVLNLPADFFRLNSTGDVYGALTCVEPLCSVICSLLFSNGIMILMSGLYLFQLRSAVPQMIMPALLVLTTELLVQIIGILGQRRSAMRRLNAQIRTNTMALDTLSGITQVKTYGAQKRALSRWMETYRAQADAEYRPPIYVKAQQAVMPALKIFGLAFLYYNVKRLGVSHEEFVFFFSAYGIAEGVIMGLSLPGEQIASIEPMINLLKPILSQAPEQEEKGMNPGKLTGDIKADLLEFRYAKDAPNVLKGLSMHIKAGEYVAVVGSSGSGKSTLVRLLLGFEKPAGGAIFYDGMELKNLDINAVRRQIGVVLQNSKLFTGNIFANIALSAPSLTEEEAWKVAEIAGLADDIRAMALGMYTIVGEGVGGLSGGQKQRLMIARAIAGKPSVLIFDEATSALDNVTQKKVTDALSSLDCTRLVIAHRLSTIRDCDRILVMERGRIVEEGSYEELMEKNGRFGELVRYQLMDEESIG